MKCREELRRAGELYPKSSCEICGSLIAENFECKKDKLTSLKTIRYACQLEIDECLDRISELTDIKKELTYKINKEKRELYEISQENERRRA